MLDILLQGLYLLSFITSLGIILFVNPVYSILSFILTVLFFSLIIFILGFDFLALVLIVVYLGAIAVLFLFIVMMLNIKILELQYTYWRYLPVSIFIFCFVAYGCFSLYSQAGFQEEVCLTSSVESEYISWIELASTQYTIGAIASVLYTYYIIFFIYISFVLFLAMVGSMALIINQNLQVRRQNIFIQREKSLKDSVWFAKNKSVN